MHKTKLIDMLKSLSKGELRLFEKRLELFGKEDRQFQLLQYLKKYAPSYESSKLDKEKVAAKIFPKESGAVKKLSYVVSSLWKLLEDFIVDQMLKEHTFVRKRLLLEYYKKRNLDKFFYSQVQKIESDMEKDMYRGIDFYYQMFQLSDLTYSHPSTLKWGKSVESLDNTMKNADIFYVITKLKYSCEMMTRERILNDSYDIFLLDPILELSELPPFKDNSLIELYKRLIQSIKNLNYEDLVQLMTVYKDHFQLLSEHERRAVLIYITNNLFLLYRSNQKEALEDQFEMNEFGLKNDIWLDDGYIFHLHFMNIFNTASILKKLDWAEQFVEEKSHLLPEDTQQNTISLCTAIISFRKKKFEKTLENLRDVQFSDIHFNIVAKNIMLKCYYELDDYEIALHDFLHAYTMYLKRNSRINSTFKNANLNLIKFTRRLVKERFASQEGSEKLISDLQNESNISDRKWLEQKINAL